MAFQERNGTCGMKPERSGWNLAEKSGTDRDLKWDEICSVLFRFLNWYELVWNISAIPGETERNWQPWFKVVFDSCPKIKVVKMVFWPYHCEEEEETSTLVKTTQKSNMTACACEASIHARRRTLRVFFARMGWSDPNTRWSDPCAWTGWGWHQHDTIVTSACPIGMPCQWLVSWHVSTVGPTCHAISRESSRGIGSSVADPTCNRMWDWIWAVD